MSNELDEFLPVSRFDYDLPRELIAQQPIEPRDAARLLVVSRRERLLSDHVFHELPNLLQPGDLLVVNDTRVLPARLIARRVTGGQLELLLLSRQPDGCWTALAKPARRLRSGERFILVTAGGDDSGETATIVRRDESGVVVSFGDESVIRRHGRTPLPPYITERVSDPERYQTIYGRLEGSAAAPTAGLHFTPGVLERCRERGVTMTTVTLHVGLDTFQPIKTQDAREHRIHSEWFEIPAESLRAVRDAKRSGRRIVAVGTTSVRTLESASAEIMSDDDDVPTTLSGSTRLYITPGYRY
ncbi:MAG: S-adenosylmethionine:tRNA ribosyltransferase-isomerase, partial [Vicinamibacterales bacterium]